MLDVARRLFAECGHAETTLEAIATEGGVPLTTRYAIFHSKRGLLSRLLGHLVVGEQGASSILETAGARAVFAEADPRRALTLFANHMAEIQARVATTVRSPRRFSFVRLEEPTSKRTRDGFVAVA